VPDAVNIVDDCRAFSHQPAAAADASVCAQPTRQLLLLLLLLTVTSPSSDDEDDESKLQIVGGCLVPYRNSLLHSTSSLVTP